MPDSVGHFFAGELRTFSRNENNLVTATGKLAREREPRLLHRAAPDRRHRQKRAGHNRDLHFEPTNFCSTDNSESVARLISKCSSKHLSALTRIDCRSCSLVASQRSSNRLVPAKSSFST